MDHQVPKSKWKLFWSKPPFVVFLFCLALFALTTFSLSVYVAQTDKIPNPNVLDWNKLLKKLTKLEFCLPQNPPKIPESLQVKQENWITSALQIQVSQDFVTTFQENKIIKAQSEVLTKYLGHLPSEFLNHSLILSLDIPNKPSSSACLQVQGPKNLLQYLAFNQTTCPTVQAGTTVTTLLSHSSDHKPPTWCENPQDLKVNLDFNMLNKQNPDLTMYVTPADKELIHLHLMVTSVFLFAILAAVIMGFLIRTVSNKRKEHVMLSQTDTDDHDTV